MTSISSLEPQASGLIVLKTTFGDLEVELFTQQCPNATKNFVQLCLDNHYTGTIFNRVEKDFIAIGGVVEGESDEAEHFFKDEFHPRLKFSRRGLLATANTEKDANGAQFFFTLGPAPELQNKHTIFGRLKGKSIYHLVDLNECQVDDDLVPLSEKKILETIVIENPYSDLKPREEIIRKAIDKDPKEEDDYYDPLSKPKPDLSKSKKLSFYQDSDDDDEASKANVSSGIEKGASGTNDLKHNFNGSPKTIPVNDDKSDTNTGESSPVSKETGEAARERRLREIRAQIQALKDQIETGSESPKLSEGRAADERQEVAKSPKIRTSQKDSNHVAELRKGTKRGHQRERETLALLENFKKKLKEQSNDAMRSGESIKRSNDPDDKQVKVDKQEVDKDDLFHEDNELLDDLDKVDCDAWLQHKFEPMDNYPRLANDANTKDDNWYSIDDPRNPMKKRVLNNHAHEYRRSQNSSHRRSDDERSGSSNRHSNHHHHSSSSRKQ